ncbi:fungal-specific transcription factor domain-containing protein [Phascolomyces articulosus]|uniref:Fungal-specific transcription factor domain-containing protein n=1 Tax=Phascolomyces articulosus TaxID=60185 RepID=A0AAD5JMX2_9FUNG|nr:fungal-specific transcription factor domain-containing protein [Phascolomyces articulosus]
MINSSTNVQRLPRIHSTHITMPTPDKEFDHKIRLLNETSIKNGKRSCDNCRRRKVRCDSNINHPCSKCRKTGTSCEFLIIKKKPGPVAKKYKNGIEKRVKQPEALPTIRERVSNKQTIHHRDNITPLPQPLMPIPPCQQTSTAVINHSNYNTHLIPTKDLINKIPDLTFELAEHIIQGYFKFVHIKGPVLHKHSFLTQFYYEYPQPLDERLFYTVCAIGCQFLPWEAEFKDNMTVRKIGRSLRKMAKKVTDLAIGQQPSISTVQVLVMASMMFPNATNDDESSTNLFILDSAIRMSQDLGLYSGSSQEQNLSANEIQIRRRIPYAIHTLDRLSAAARGKQFMIKEEDLINVEIPSPYELEAESIYMINVHRMDPIPKILKETETDIRDNIPIYAGFIQMISLSRMVGDVLLSLYLPRGSQLSDPSSINNLDMAITKWQSSVLSDIHNKSVITNIRRDVLVILYNVILLLRYRPLVFAKQFSDHSNEGTCDLMNFCTKAAMNIIEQFESDGVLGLPCMTDYMVGEAASIFIQDCHSQDPIVRSQARKNLLRCAALLLRDEAVSHSQNAKVLRQLTEQMAGEME